MTLFQLFRRIIPYVKPHRFLLAATLSLTLIGSLLAQVNAVVLDRTVDAMPAELMKAHRANDLAVLEAYGFPRDATESEIVARLFKMYQELTK